MQPSPNQTDRQPDPASITHHREKGQTMTRDEAKTQIHEATRDILSKLLPKAKSPVNHEPSYICPFCGHGKSGDGLAINKHSKGGFSLKCFGCDFSGDIIDLYQKMNGADYNTALSLLAEGIGISIDTTQAAQNRPQTVSKVLPDKNTDDTHESQQKATEALVDYTEYYQKCTARLEDTSAISFLKARGITLETAKKYSLGYDPTWISPTVIQNQEAKGSSWRPTATERIIIPTSENAYIARAVRADGPIRYANEGKPLLFNVNALYGDSETIFVTEGAFDALSIIQCGAVAIGLNSTSNIHALLQRLNEKPPQAILLLALDNDAAGQKASKELADGLDKIGIRYIIANISGACKDPNEALQKSPEAFKAAIQNAIDEAKKPPKDDFQNFIDKIQTRAYEPHPTGLSFFDELLNGGILQQSLLLIGAAPGTGKTALCQQVAEEMAAHGKDVIYLNFEMSQEQMLARAISYRMAKKGLWITASEVLQGYNWNDTIREQLQTEFEIYRNRIYPHIKYNPNIAPTLESLQKYLTQIGDSAKANGKEAPAVILDYIHLIGSEQKMDTQELLKQVVTTLKRYAVQYDTFVIGINAINRASSNKALSLNSGRDSSNLEYTGDYMLSLNYWAVDKGLINANDPEAMEKESSKIHRNMILRLHKSRFGAGTGNKKLYYRAKNNIFWGEYDIPVDIEEELSPFDEPTAKGKSR